MEQVLETVYFWCLDLLFNGRCFCRTDEMIIHSNKLPFIGKEQSIGVSEISTASQATASHWILSPGYVPCLDSGGSQHQIDTNLPRARAEVRISWLPSLLSLVVNARRLCPSAESLPPDGAKPDPPIVTTHWP
jgi:hypothetical protein